MPAMDDAAASPIERLLSGTEQVTGLHVTVHDRSGSLAGHLEHSWYMHRNPACRAGRDGTTGFDERCRDHCWMAMNRRAAESAEPFVHTCWKGFAEACAPVFRDGVHRLTLFGGATAAAATPPPGLEAVAVRAWRTLPPPDPARLLAVARLLVAVGHGLLAEAETTCHPAGDARRAVIAGYVEAELYGPASIAGLARHLELSPSRAAHVVRDLFGVSFGELLQTRRIARAQHLLATSDDSVGAISRACGFISQPWFSRLFTRLCGASPGRWRKAHRPQA
jgi:AraC-like DNA-binding protein